MTTEQPPRDALRPLRPLASVGIPLLREERSALRNRRLAIVAIAGATLAMAGGGLAFWLRKDQPPGAPQPVVVPDSIGDVLPAEPEPPPAVDPVPPQAPVLPVVAAPV